MQKMIYIIHFETKLAHAQHYVGFCQDGRLGERMAEHWHGKGAKILAACRQKRIHYEVVRTLPGSRTRERQIKKTHATARYCPVCKSKFRKP